MGAGALAAAFTGGGRLPARRSQTSSGTWEVQVGVRDPTVRYQHPSLQTMSVGGGTPIPVRPLPLGRQLGRAGGVEGETRLPSRELEWTGVAQRGGAGLSLLPPALSVASFCWTLRLARSLPSGRGARNTNNSLGNPATGVLRGLGRAAGAQRIRLGRVMKEKQVRCHPNRRKGIKR